MIYTIATNYRACTLRVDIEAQKSCQVKLEVCDAKQADTYFTKRTRFFAPKEKQSFDVQMPVTGHYIRIMIFEGTDVAGKPVSFKVTGMKLTPLTRQMDVLPGGKQVRDFVRFAERFCFNAGVIPTYTQRVYTNEEKLFGMTVKKGEFQIRYLDAIRSEDGQQELTTPARIGIYDKIIEVSKKKFKPMSVPVRLCILFHEFSHLYLNKEMTDEVEADLNGLHIYLALGYPRIEAHETFLETFYSAQTEVNYERYDRISSFIDTFEQLTYKRA